MSVDRPGAAAFTPKDIRAIFIGIMLAVLLSALDQTIVATAMPTIGRDFGDVTLLPWVVTGYLLASTAVTPLYGKVADMVGRRITMLVGIGIFVLGSVACAAAPSMPVLIGGRVLQGLGGGGLIAVAQTIIADVVTPRERGRYQVYLGAVFATANVAGPVLGGVFAESLHWSLIFWINLPLGAVAYWLVDGQLKKLPVPGRRHRLDVLGAILMSGGSIALLLALTWGGTRFPWGSAAVLGTLAASALLFCGFGVRIAHAAEPLIPPSVLRDPVVALAVASSALAMGCLVGLIIVVPLFFENGLGMTARESGYALIPLMMGTVVGATGSGRAMAELHHYKRVPMVGLAAAVAAAAALAFGSATLPFWALVTLLGFVSLGIGTLFPVATVCLQNASLGPHLGTATATMNFARQLTGAVIVALFGAIVLASHGAHGSAATSPDPAVAASIRWVFAASAAGIGAALALFLFMEERPLRGAAPEPVAPEGVGTVAVVPVQDEKTP